MDARFPRSSRLTDQAQFAAVFNSGKRLQNEHFRLVARHNGLNHSRLGLAIAKRAIPHAVQRNRLKRLSRELFRQFPQACALDLVVMAKPLAGQTNNASLRGSLTSLWQRMERKLCPSPSGITHN